nr:hypothetical protein GCM10020092_029900 [Actinoplanes digitatis]
MALINRAGLAAVVAGCLLAGCDGGGADGVPVVVATSTAVSTPRSVPDLDAGEEIARGIDVPWGLAFLPGGDALVAERDTGRVLRLTPGGGAAREVYRVPGVRARNEGGLLGLAVSPAFADDGMVYAYFTAARDNRIVRFRLGGGPPEVVFDGIAKARYHNGGRIAFGPDGMLYVGTGDAGETSRAPDPASPNGKILRLTPGGALGAGQPGGGFAGVQPGPPQRAGTGLGLRGAAVRHRVRAERTRRGEPHPARARLRLARGRGDR